MSRGDKPNPTHQITARLFSAPSPRAGRAGTRDLTPLKHRLSICALLANVPNDRYPGKVRLRHNCAEIDLGRLDARSDRGAVNTLEHTSGEADDGGQARAGAGAYSASALVELVEDDLPGHEFVDIVVKDCDKKSCFLNVLGLRLLVEKVLAQVRFKP